MFLFAGLSEVLAIEPRGFDGIPFGVSREQMVEEIFKRGLVPEEQSVAGQVVIPKYNFGELPVEIVFRFNRNGKFFSYELRTGKVEKDRFNKVIEAVRYMSERLEGLFGTPKKKNYFRLEQIQGKRFAQYWIWEHPDIDVVTFIRSMDARYFTQGTVTHKQLAREGFAGSAE